MHPYFELIPKYFPELSEKQISRFEHLWGFYHDWNSKINVISRKDIDELYLRHVLHSLAIARIYKFNPGNNILDVGTGGGFPGIPLCIFFEDVTCTLVDSIGKKIKVVQTAIDELGLDNAKAIHTRAEDIKDKFDMVVSRAVTQLPKFISWVNGKIIPGNTSGVGNGIIYIKGGDLEEELASINWHADVHQIQDIFSEDFFKTKKVVHLYKG